MSLIYETHPIIRDDKHPDRIMIKSCTIVREIEDQMLKTDYVCAFVCVRVRVPRRLFRSNGVHASDRT